MDMFNCYVELQEGTRQTAGSCWHPTIATQPFRTAGRQLAFDPEENPVSGLRGNGQYVQSEPTCGFGTWSFNFFVCSSNSSIVRGVTCLFVQRDNIVKHGIVSTAVIC